MLAINQDTLAYQVDQHFAFNTLNSIQRLILENQSLMAMQYIAQFGKLIRSTLYQTKNEYLTLEEEIHNLELYLKMELLRTKERFSYKIEVGHEVDIYNRELPTGLIQPLVEQSIWYGLIPTKERGEIRIRFYKAKTYLLCEIEDNGAKHTPLFPELKRKKSHPTSQGILLFKQRLEALNQGSKFPIRLESEAYDQYSEAPKNLIRLKIPILRYQ